METRRDIRNMKTNHGKHKNQKNYGNHKKLPTGTTEERYKNHNEQKNHDNQ